jgi:excinuclease UvrABC helicase subunit UvrB
MSNNEAYICCIGKRYKNHAVKSMQKNKDTVKRRRDVATLVAEIHGVTADHVRKVIRGDRENEQILTTYMEILEGDSLLLIAVKKAVPFDSSPDRKK